MTQGAQQSRNGDAGSQGTTSGGPSGERTITVPDGKGGEMRIVISQRGVSIDGEAVTGADAQALIPPRPPAPPARARKDIPDGVITVVAMGCAMVVAVSLGSPLVRAFTRWLDRRSEVARPSDDVVQRLAAIEQAVELVAVEVERISEGQRFTAKLLADRASQDLERVR